ncbi:protein kinase [Actinosynnema pretiosum subsp. pretiosum]|uniref:non-specific serine/threonine protein kinase n=1 Tax=Actinosynnema pretiosum subsp. pretiosum TaxID=103721 RepID=A0AA45R4A9_9PSEU|nr:putative serine/threonine protein kinase [Actinosynnema pretiosum subsp. pretiosum]QUF04443.1 protein kinase [Actinosynnema pretiosum subsp. pretiosum]
MPHAGELIAGRYRLESLVGQGAMGVVWRGRDEEQDRVIAVKLLEESVRSADSSAWIAREGRIATRLRHPNAITVHDVVEHDGTPCLVMEYLPSHSLGALLDERGPLPPGEVARIGGLVASALTAAHQAGIVHRDVTPYNILISHDDGDVKITDFGVARAVGEGTVTDARQVVGTPAFLAPEVASGESASHASDVFSLGSTLYTAVEGHPPFGRLEDNPYALLRRAAKGEVTPPRTTGPLADVLVLLMAREPDHRPTMAQARQMLQATAEGKPLPPAARTLPAPGAPPAPAPTPPAAAAPQGGRTMMLAVRRQLSLRPMAWAGIAGALLAGGVVLGFALSTTSDDKGASTQAAPDPSSSEPPMTTTAYSRQITPRVSTPTETEESEEESQAPSGPGGCEATLTITNSWPNGFQGEVVVRNPGGAPVSGWTVSWTATGGETISSSWNGKLNQNSGTVVVSNEGYNGTIQAGGSTNFGFNGAGEPPASPAVSCTAG